MQAPPSPNFQLSEATELGFEARLLGAIRGKEVGKSCAAYFKGSPNPRLPSLSQDRCYDPKTT